MYNISVSIVFPSVECNRSPILGHSPGDLEGVDYGQEDTDGSSSSSDITLRPEVNFPAKAGDHLVQERIWDELKSAVVCIR